METSEAFLLRHGESTWNVERRWQGHGDPPLTVLGRQQAEAAVERLVASEIQVIASSDLQRARETALIVAGVLGLPVEFEPAWRELDVGRWTGLTRSEIRQRWPAEYERFRSGDPSAPALGGESRAQLGGRARGALEELRDRHPGRRALVVTHRGVIRALSAVEGQLGNGEIVRLEAVGTGLSKGGA